MNGITILIWITIAIIAIIAIIAVKLHYKGEELENDEGSILPDTGSINEMLSSGKSNNNSSNNSYSNNRPSLSPRKPENNQAFFSRNTYVAPKNDAYIVPQKEEENNLQNYEYESQNQVLVDYGNTVEKFQEPIKQNQMDIMTQNNKDKTELKDLFTIDELIKESKRKDSEREKESRKITSDEDEDLTDIKESIKRNRENKTEEPLIEEIIEKTEKEETISDLINDTASEEVKTEEKPLEVTTQKDIDEAISTASKETEEEITSISEDNNITDVLLDSDDDSKDIQNEKIKEPALKTPSKVGENTDYKLGASIDDANLFGNDDDDTMDLDYRKDLDRVANKIRGSKIFQEVKEKLTPETEEAPETGDETFIRNVNEYDEFEPIINETHVDYDDLHEITEDEKLRQENTRRVFNMAKRSPEPELAEPKIGSIKDKPVRDNIKITINNNEEVLKKGDEIIFNHLGETYSSQVYAINGDDISVRYRRQNITIKPEDVKKIY